MQRSDAYRAVVPYYLLQIEFRDGNYRYVVENGDELVRRAVPERRQELERVIAESWFHLGDYNKTIGHLDAFTAAGGELDRDGSYLMGFSLYRTARYPEAAEFLRKACGAEDALTQNASYHLADCYLRAGDKQAAILHAEAVKEAKIREAEGEAQAIVAVQEAQAKAIALINEAAPKDGYLTIKSLEASAKAADGKATKLIIPSELQSLAGLAASAKEIFSADAAEDAEQK